MNKDLLTATEAAELVSVSRGTIQYWVRTGRIKAERAPRSELAMRRRPGDRTSKLLIDRKELIAATSDGIEAAVRRAHPDKRLASTADICHEFKVDVSTACRIVKQAGVEKIPLFSNRYLFDADELLAAMEDSPSLSYYLYSARVSRLTR